MTYQQAATKAIQAWDRCRNSSRVKEIEKTAQFRKLVVYESGGNEHGLNQVLFGLEYCSKDGDNYREIYVSVHYYWADQRPYTVDVRLDSIHEC